VGCVHHGGVQTGGGYFQRMLSIREVLAVGYRKRSPFIFPLLITVVLLAMACGGPALPASPPPAAAPLMNSDPAPSVDSSRRANVGSRTGPVQNLRFERISIKQGLSHSTVNCILQDSKGFMWLGTSDGLNKYDGYSFTVYKHDPNDPHSLSHNLVSSLFEDSTGMLWVGTYGGGLNRFDRDTGQFTRYDTDDFQNITDEPEEYRNAVLAIDEHPTGVLWIATNGGGLVKFDLETGTFTSYAPDPVDPEFWGHEWITALLIDSSGIVWLGTGSEGLDRFDPATGQTTTYRHNPDSPDSLGFDWITEIIQDRSGAIWIGTPGRGLDRFDPETERFSHYRHDSADPHSLSHDHIQSIVQDSGGMLWIGTSASGLDVFDPRSETFAHVRHDPTDPSSLSSDRIQTLFVSQSGILWAGTQGGGVNKSDPASGRFTHYRGDHDDPQRPSDYPVSSLLEDEDRVLWIGTAGGGLDGLDRETGAWRHYRHDPADPLSSAKDTVLAIHKDAAGTLWIGTGWGFYRFDRQTGRFDRLPHNPPDPGDVKTETIDSIYEDQAGILWLGTRGRGLSEFDPATGAFTYHQHGWDPDTGMPERHTLSSNFVRDVVEDGSGVLWIGTSEGLNIYDRETGQWSVFQHDPSDPHSLSHNQITSLHQDRSGTLWVGTLGGLNRYDSETGTFSHYREQDGLANNRVFDILEDDRGTLWITTANGLSQFDPHTETFKSYGADDGLPISEFGAVHKSDSGELFFGGINGFMSFFPDQMEDNPYVPPVVLTSLQQNGVEVNTGQAPEDLREVTFRWPDNSFEFGFTALNYTQPEKNQHAYMLEGFDRDWNHIGPRRFGRYTNLPGGTYTLRLKGSNNDGVWNEEGVSLKVTVVPPLWGTWWFWGIVALILAGSAFGGYRLRVRSLEARSRELERRVEREIERRMQVEEALRESEMERAVAAERSRLARELHDAVTQTLFSASLIAEALPTLWMRDQEMGRERLAMLRQMSRGALAEMRTLLLELRPAALVETSLEDLLRQLGEAVTGREGVPVTVEVEGLCELPADLHVALYRIAQEALNNVVKHAQASQVAVSLRCTPRVPSPSLREGEGSAVEVELRIRDDGRGFDPDDVSPEHMGLGIMRERAEAVGAQLGIVSQTGRGTQVTVVWREDEGQQNNRSSSVC
jgi:ligand-binding sensor domain-containing protein/signal transduction histidine kinase